ncbi:MAG: hypothetical protein AB7E73_03820 [Burkholderiales bacterium]
MSVHSVRAWFDDIRARSAVCFEADQLRSTVCIALCVGTWLIFVNQADILVEDGLSSVVLSKILMNYLTPFVVANLGVISRKK